MEVHLLPLSYTVVSENETFSICAELTNGTVGCNVTVTLDVRSGSAVGETVCRHDYSKFSGLLLQTEPHRSTYIHC